MINVYGSAPSDYPVEIIYSLLECKGASPYEVPKLQPINWGLGNTYGNYFPERFSFPIPNAIDFLWLSIAEETIYQIKAKLDTSILSKILKEWSDNNLTIAFVIGYAPKGHVYIWLKSKLKSFIAFKYIANIKLKGYDANPFAIYGQKLSDYCVQVKENNPLLFNMNYPFKDEMKQFTYRYLIFFEEWSFNDKIWVESEKSKVAIEFDGIEECLYDGTHDKLNDGGLLKYHQAGKPKELAIKWHIGKSEYSAYFWFEEEPIREVFDKFYGAHPDTKTDFIIRIDAENRKYELALYRYALKEPQIISQDVYQLLVFKNKFEDYRSDNYNQERGAWIW